MAQTEEGKINLCKLRKDINKATRYKPFSWRTTPPKDRFNKNHKK